MDHMSAGLLVFLVISGFIASFIDSIVGGGGLISIPALMLTGLPPSHVLGTNKLASSLSSLTSTLSYLRSGKVEFRLVKYLFPLSLIGSLFGAYTVGLVPSTFLKPVVLILLIGVTVYSIVKKDKGKKTEYRGITKKILQICVPAAFAIGFYDGFFGPGTGSFLIIVFLFVGFDYIYASGNAKALNFASNIAGLAMFMFQRSVNYHFGIVMGIAMILGSLAGSQFAIKKGAAVVRPIFICVTVVLIGKQLWNMF
ncbi:TSUP family transporter [Fodinisporobacter ferrooxydans]|uniref:Probable membrane transporter protein n=1 Tax=Fodinisporobacter ferrooxydans TaxID=2901836 RepID=A0ABY4CFH3_9BACL|nr:TSUP family transporter [Alicyclobacillaceae bacterium MYW30-H2]